MSAENTMRNWRRRGLHTTPKRRAGGASRPATHFVLKVEIGGLAGWLAPLVGKKPPDSHVWILEGQAPAFVASEQPLYLGGPLWRIEVTSPTLQAPTDEVR